MKNGKCTSFADHRFTLNDMDTGGLGSHCTNCGITRSEALQKSWSDRYQTVQVHTPQDVDQARNQQLDQLKANAEAHKKHVDRLNAKILLLTQRRDYMGTLLSLAEKNNAFYRVELERRLAVAPDKEKNKSEQTKWSTLLLGAGFVYLSGFLLTLGFFSAVGWVEFAGRMLR